MSHHDSNRTIEKGAPLFPDAGNWNILNDDLLYPVLVLKESALHSNIDVMARWCQQNGFLLAPHGKTTMCPPIFQRQLAAGAWGITAATAQQTLVCLKAGARRVLIANQVMGKVAAGLLARALTDDVEIYCLADSIAVVEQLAAYLHEFSPARPLRVLIEWGRPDWRTGVASLEQGMSVYEAIRRHRPVLEYAGVEAFEGTAHEHTQAEEFLQRALSFAGSMPEPEGAPFLFSAGGSSFLSGVLKYCGSAVDRYSVVLRSGCYVTHDHGFYADKLRAAQARGDSAAPAFTAALELWAVVQSVQSPESAILTFGKRDCAYDLGLPIPLHLVPRGSGLGDRVSLDGASIKQINDQHAFLTASPVPLSVGDRVCCGISHPCTAFDKWRVIPVVDDAYNVLDFYRTCF